jgi:Matrixin
MAIKKQRTASPDPFALLEGKKLAKATESHIHVFGNGFKCKTDSRGYATQENKGNLELRVDATEGYIPLWSIDTTLRWRFQKSTFASFVDPKAAENTVKKLFSNALLAWGDAVPVKFAEREDNWDFEIAIRESDDCDNNGCTLASAFFPDGGQHELTIYPKMFAQSQQEQIETLAHELGHVFGLRHFFALVSEKAWPSEAFGSDSPFSIMNYGADSKLADADRSDLKRLYELAWSGQLKYINKTMIKFMNPHHVSGI